MPSSGKDDCNYDNKLMSGFGDMLCEPKVLELRAKVLWWHELIILTGKCLVLEQEGTEINWLWENEIYTYVFYVVEYGRMWLIRTQWRVLWQRIWICAYENWTQLLYFRESGRTWVSRTMICFMSGNQYLYDSEEDLVACFVSDNLDIRIRLPLNKL